MSAGVEYGRPKRRALLGMTGDLDVQDSGETHGGVVELGLEGEFDDGEPFTE